MDRRSFIKGAVIAAATPAVTFAPAIATTIAGLITAYQDADREHGRLVKLSNEMFDRPDNPGMPCVMRSEIAPRWRFQFNKSRLEFRDAISKGFDEAVKTLKFNFETFRANASHYDKLVSETKAEKHRVLALYEARDKVYRDWRDVSGVEAVDREIDRMDDVRDDLEKKIVAFQPETLDDLKIKVGYFKAQYGDDMSGTYARHVLLNLLGSAA